MASKGQTTPEEAFLLNAQGNEQHDIEKLDLTEQQIRNEDTINLSKFYKYTRTAVLMISIFMLVRYGVTLSRDS